MKPADGDPEDGEHAARDLPMVSGNGRRGHSRMRGSHRRARRETDLTKENEMPDQKFNACIEACNACVVACNHCAASCLQEQDVNMMARCIALDMDCSAICATAVAAMARGSDFSGAICAICADICQSCGDECVKHKMEHCQACAKACHRCAQECRKMAAMA